MAAIFLDAQGCVGFVNARAADILEAQDGLTIRRRRLSASLTQETALLQRAIAGAIGTTSGTTLQAGGALAISRPSGRRAYGVLVTPLRGTNHYVRHGAAAVFLSDPDRDAPANVTMFRALFGLTAAESRVAALVAQGQSFAEVVDRLQISAATGRTHLKNIFAKTATRTQAQLVRLLLSSVPPVA